MTVATAVRVIPHDVALWIDPIRIRQNGSREIDRRKIPFAQQKPVGVTAVVNVVSHNVAAWIDIEEKRLRRAREIHSSQSILAQKKTMRVAAAVPEESHDVAARGDRLREGKCGPRYIDRTKNIVA